MYNLKFALVWLATLPRRAWKYFTVERLVKIREVASILTLVLVAYISLAMLDLQRQGRDRGKEIQGVTREIQEVTRIIEEQTNPEAQERQRELVNFIVESIGCENRQALQDLVNVLVEREVLEPGILQVITAECQAILDNQAQEDETSGRTTSTTTLPGD